MSALEPTVLLVLFAVVVAAQMVETMTGFGATVISLSIGVHVVPLDRLVVTLVLIGLLQSAWIVARGWTHVRWRLLAGRVLPWCGLGLVAGNVVFHRVEAEVLRLVLGGFVVVFLSWRLWQLLTGRQAGRLSSVVGSGFLVGGGFFHGLFATGGPLVVYYASRTIDQRRAFRATLSTLWLLLNTALLGSFWLHGRIEQAPVTLAAALLPAVALGIFVGEKIHDRVDEVLFRKVVQALLLVTGLFLLV